MYCFELWRSPERQERLKKKGVTRAGAWESPHQYGLAIDIISVTDFWDLAPESWEYIGQMGKEVARKCGVKMEWLGDPKHGFYDPAHWQMENWKAYKTVIDAYQLETIDPYTGEISDKWETDAEFWHEIDNIVDELSVKPTPKKRARR